MIHKASPNSRRLQEKQRIFLFGRPSIDSQLTVSVLVASSGSVVAALVALQRYSAPLSSGFRMNEICFDTMFPVTRVEPRISRSPAIPRRISTTCSTFPAIQTQHCWRQSFTSQTDTHVCSHTQTPLTHTHQHTAHAHRHTHTRTFPPGEGGGRVAAHTRARHAENILRVNLLPFRVSRYRRHLGRVCNQTTR